MPDQTTLKTRTITLTERPPVRIREANWPIIARADGNSWEGHRGDGRYHQALAQGELDEYKLIVRQHADGRTLVYGIFASATMTTRPRPDWRGGELLDPQDDLDYAERATRAIVDAIHRVGRDGDLPANLIRECIADLPPEEL